MPDVAAEYLLADKAYDAQERVLDILGEKGAERYKDRHLVKNFFLKLRHFRAIATRYDKTARNFLAAIYLTATTIWLA